MPLGRTTLLAFRFNGKCRTCQHPASAIVWKIKHAGVPEKRVRQLARVAAQGFQEGTVDVERQNGVSVVCSACGGRVLVSEVKGRFKHDVPCDARCTTARGHNCECSCGGANHGADWA